MDWCLIVMFDVTSSTTSSRTVCCGWTNDLFNSRLRSRGKISEPATACRMAERKRKGEPSATHTKKPRRTYNGASVVEARSFLSVSSNASAIVVSPEAILPAPPRPVEWTRGGALDVARAGPRDREREPVMFPRPPRPVDC